MHIIIVNAITGKDLEFGDKIQDSLDFISLKGMSNLSRVKRYYSGYLQLSFLSVVVTLVLALRYLGSFLAIYGTIILKAKNADNRSSGGKNLTFLTPI
jgi:hypothetical protein